MTPRTRLLLTPGDPEGIGPELTRRLFAARKLPKGVDVICVGAAAPLRGRGLTAVEIDPNDLGRPGFKVPIGAGKIAVVPVPPPPSGKSLHVAGYQSGRAVEMAVQLIQRGVAHALVTGPISKERLQKGGYPFRGHTDFLAKLAGDLKVTMMLANERLRVSLVTTHLPLKEVPEAITASAIRGTVMRTLDFLTSGLGVSHPTILVCGLNPHSGESGLLGDEELRVICPAVDDLTRELGNCVEIRGPIPSDTLFAVNDVKPAKHRADAVIAMYHDQGLIPVKLLDFPRTVNLTLGLPFPRTSVDHGVAFDLVGRDVANPSSLEAALAWAARLCKSAGSHKRPIRHRSNSK
ncbi:MAG: 4-hydroxythreonine-4-phosphate dehydrogenase PdxA [Bdellovibrionales bacterium]|nr:4-hydroxythreonine-4-phosphate dehydrogenase PdxA [Bdellovibrionales bacterium]